MTIAFISQDLVQVKPSFVQPTDTETKYKRSPEKEVRETSLIAGEPGCVPHLCKIPPVGASLYARPISKIRRGEEHHAEQKSISWSWGITRTW